MKPFLTEPLVCPEESGLTLIETVVVVAILGILAAIVLPDMKSLFSGDASMTLLQEAKQVAMLARNRAMGTNTPVSVAVSGCSWSLAYVGTPPSGAQTLPSLSASNSDDVCTGSFTVQYNPNGWLTTAQGQPVSETWSIVNGGSSGALVLHAGGAVDVQ